MSAKRRVLKDYKDFIKNNIPGCYVRVREENALIWDAIIKWSVDDATVVPFHMVIVFPDTYLSAAPKVGFSCMEFGYQNGASEYFPVTNLLRL
jgi:ubiquitin-protein ligase